jgi:hypothetical protein
MAPTLAKPFHRPGWVFEEKYDGWRYSRIRTAHECAVVSRTA